MMTMAKNTKIDPILEYIEKYPPYKSHVDLGIDIRALSRYADEHGKNPDELTEDEVKMFKK